MREEDASATHVLHTKSYPIEYDSYFRTHNTHKKTEFTLMSFDKYCDELGVQRHLTTPYSPSRMGWWSTGTRPSSGRLDYCC